MSDSRHIMPGIAILQQIDVSIERLLAVFRWKSIDAVDALRLWSFRPQPLVFSYSFTGSRSRNISEMHHSPAAPTSV